MMDNNPITTDIMKLITSMHEVTIINEGKDFFVKFFGPRGTPFEGGVWKIYVLLPTNYPFQNPSIWFVNKIYHPNVVESTGFVVWHMRNGMWTPCYDLYYIFEVFLPDLLTYPELEIAVNLEAAVFYLNDRDKYHHMVTTYARSFAMEEAVSNDHANSCESDSDVSSLSEYEDKKQNLEHQHGKLEDNV